jgi:hypothetical protein
MRRYLRAFFGALWLTLRGKTLQPPAAAPRYPALAEWVRVGTQRAATVVRIAEKNGWDEARRKSLSLRIDGRPMTMETIVRAVEHNMTREYPLLMATTFEGAVTTLYALNMNDQHRVRRLADAPELADGVLRDAVLALADHLDRIPPSNQIG